MAEALSNFFKKITGRGGLQPLAPARSDVLQSKEIIDPEHTVVLQVTDDGSLGADVVRVAPDKLILVDGAESGASGDREGAMQLATILESTSDVPKSGTGAHIALDFNPDFFRLRAYAGGVGIIYRRGKEHRIKPDVFYFGEDSFHVPVVDREVSLTAATHLVLLSDGGIDLLANKDLFGDRWEFKHELFLRLVEDINAGEQSLVVNKNDIVYLLEPLTGIINGIFSPDALTDALRRRFKTFSAIAPHDTGLFEDDATIVIATIESKI